MHRSPPTQVSPPIAQSPGPPLRHNPPFWHKRPPVPPERQDAPSGPKTPWTSSTVTASGHSLKRRSRLDWRLARLGVRDDQ
jgi:hypothetical protein